MADGYTPIKTKCTWWRERMLDEDAYNTRVKDDEKRLACSCFVEGLGWTFARAQVPTDCPLSRQCRYWIKHH